MSWIHQLTVRGSVLLFIAIATLSAAALGAIGFINSTRSHAITEQLHTDVQLARAAGLVDMMHDGLRATVLSAMLAGPQASADEERAIRDELAEFTQNINQALAEFDQQADSPALRAALVDAKPVVQRYVQTAGALVAKALTEPEANPALHAAFLADFKQLEEKLEQLGAQVESRAAASVHHRDALLQQSHVATAATLLVTLVALLGYGLYFGRALIRRLGAEPARLADFAHRIAKGELHTRFDRSQMSPGSVAEAMVAMRDRLRAAVASIRAGADSVAIGATQIAGGNHELSSRTERQAGRLQVAASSMAQMTGSVKQTAEHARLASQLADQASQVAQRGGQSVQRVVATMGEIQQSSQKIADIINVIDGIAFQTNILALNAAVEAARAGEQGRGFAVVAAEVRSLAQRSAGAAREIKALIEASVDRVETGHQVVIEAGSLMQEIVGGVTRVTDLIGEIRVASGEQDQGIVQVTQSVSQLDQDTQGNASLVEQTAAAASTLREQADRLARSVATFKLEAA